MRISRPTSWKFALFTGFITQLLLIAFVAAIGLQQLEVTTDNLNKVVDINMHKQNLAKAMVVTARERTLIMLMLTRIEDPFERDELLLQFYNHGAEFGKARQALLHMPLNDKERELLDLQGRLTGINRSVQEEVIDLTNTDRIQEAATLAITTAIPAQNDTMLVLSQLDAEIQELALAATRKAQDDHKVARFWIYLLSVAALLVGIIVAAVVISFTNRINREREQLATQDPLTGLPNRTLLMDRLEQSLIRAKRNRSLVGVMFIDLDRFKRINDTLGHSSGDMLICEVAQRLLDTLRSEDIVARLGGDEFVVITGDMTTLNSILHVVEKMIEVMAKPYQISGHEIFTTCSMGVSIYPSDGTTGADLLKHADTAMYHAKKAGRNCFHLYDTAMNAMAEERLQLEAKLHHAIERNEFVFYYQPQLNLENGRIQGVEALIRWNSPDQGLLSPAVFLELLEETGGIISVGRTLLISACQQTASWHAAGFTDMHVAVNVSSKEFWHDSLITNICDALAQSGLPPQYLQVELTEGIFMQDIQAAVDKILSLKALGLQVSVDDFGTGYSSLAHLKRFPLDVLKIDRYFVRDLPNDQATKALINSILALCKGLGLGTIAEGVESTAQLESLRELGCPIIQGYLISQPVHAEKIIPLLNRDWLIEFARH